MQLPRPQNPEYAAIVVRIPALIPLAGRDRIVGVPVLGRQAITAKDTYQPGDLALYFPTEVQLSADYCRALNLFRDASLNADPTVTGYLEPNRRVRALKLGSHRSDALLMPLASLTWLGLDPSLLREHDTFDTLGGIELCRKYVVPTRASSAPKLQTPKQTRIASKHFPEHLDTANWWRQRQLLDDDDQITVTQKVHGTSHRVANTLAAIPAPARLLQRLGHWVARKTGVPIQTHDYAPVYGSRRVIKDIGNADQNHFYATVDGVDLWTHYGRILDGLLPQGYIAYGELIGWNLDGSPIQKDYTYRIPHGKAELLIYRVAVVNPQGVQLDLTWDQVEEFCSTLGLKTVPVLWRGRAADFDPDQWMDTRYFEAGYRHAIPLDPGKQPDEGVVVRRDGLKPLLLKAKSPGFLRYETKELDAGHADIESIEGATELQAAA
ncbi:RNA ligase family protein [Nocardia sp. NPDC050435]|uniref:RNA ligase family protein n=1 Tax=Nocardia sp. NPDC050435 TaxID=3155040 RepID=UPI0033EC60A0